MTDTDADDAAAPGAAATGLFLPRRADREALVERLRERAAARGLSFPEGVESLLK